MNEQEFTYAANRNAIDFGDLRRLIPISADYGFDRGRPIDRYYIEDEFLKRYSSNVKGTVLEVAESTYTRRYGGGSVTTSDVLHAPPGNANANIVADIASAVDIPSDYYDCIIFTQTLFLVYDVEAALQTLHRILRPGGVLLVTMPGVSRLISSDIREPWPDYWRFTSASARRLFSAHFGDANIEVHAFGNVLVCAASLFGLACEDLSSHELEFRDPAYELLVAVAATKTFGAS